MSSKHPQAPVSPATPPARGRLLFWKVLALVLVTTALGTTAIGVYSRYVLRDRYDDFVREQITSYIRLIVHDVGSPPDTAATMRLVREHPIDIRVEAPGFQWGSDSTLPSSDQIVSESTVLQFDSGDSILFRQYDGRYHSVVRHDGAIYVIRLRSVPEKGWRFWATLLLGFVLLVLFIAAYYAVQRFLRPVGELMEGVRAVGSGNFDYEVPICSNDELGELTKAFNAMARQVAAIIASKRRLLFDVSHELRSPLTRMNVALVMLPEGKAKLSIERNIRELNTMITELLENERLAVLGGSLVVEPLDVVALTKHVIESFGSDARRIEFDTLTEKIEITADSQRMTVALRNVISNALKYSNDSDQPVKVTVFPDDHGARIIVTDQGIGIPPEAQEKVFEPFYRTDDSRSRMTGGYGLGLSLTKSIVEAHGGAIRLTSTPGCGTTVMMWLPSAPAPGAVAPSMPAGGSGERKES